MRYRVRDVLRGRLPRPSDDSGNIAMLMLVIIVSATIGALLLAMVINQTTTTRFDASRVRSLDAAQSGIDVMLGQLRNATTTGSDNKTYGTSDALPCVPQAAPMTGTANASGTMTYSVWVTYYRNDPSKGTQPAMSCVSGYGPFDSTSGSHTPRYAVITSSGLDSTNPNSASKGRTLTTTYIFQTDDVNIPGGQIQLFPNGSGAKWCMDAGSGTPAAGTTVVLRACSTAQPAPPQQVWAYRSDLSIQLVSSVTTANSSGLCLDTQASPAAHTIGDVIVLKVCNAVGSAPYNQQWSVNDYAHLEGAKSDKSTTDNLCVTAASQTALQALTLATCSGNVTDPAQTWVPTATTGAGMAGATNNQIVNYQNFATCIDLTNKNPAYGFLILFSCKQNPSPSNVAWNQKFFQALGPASQTALPQVGKLTTTNTDPGSGNPTYCLQAPAVVGGYVTAVLSAVCTTTWTWNQTKDATGAALSYANVYTVTTVINGATYCLAPSPTTDRYNGQYLKIVVAACTGGTEQKWNADPSVLSSRLTNTGEK